MNTIPTFFLGVRIVLTHISYILHIPRNRTKMFPLLFCQVNHPPTKSFITFICFLNNSASANLILKLLSIFIHSLSAHFIVPVNCPLHTFLVLAGQLITTIYALMSFHFPLLLIKCGKTATVTSSNFSSPRKKSPTFCNLTIFFISDWLNK